MPSKILNTNMGLGFQRRRKYDTDLDRFGRMETSHSELRKTRELNLQTEMKKLKNSMKTYSILRFSSYPYKVTMTEFQLRMFSKVLQREFGMGDALSNTAGTIVNTARDVTGSTIEATGKTVSSVGKPIASITGGTVGAGGGALIGAGLGSIIPVAGTALGAIGGGILGATAGSGIAKGVVGGVGDAVKDMGQNIHT